MMVVSTIMDCSDSKPIFLTTTKIRELEFEWFEMKKRGVEEYYSE